MTRIKTDKSIIFIDIELTEKDIPGSKIGKDIEKATKNNFKFRLVCSLKFKSSETKAELFTLMNLRNRKENRANNLLIVHDSKIMYNII